MSNTWGANSWGHNQWGDQDSVDISITASTGNTFNLALYTSSATLGAGTTAYTTSEEITGTGYTAKGAALTSITPTLDSTTACCDFDDVSFTSASFTANGCLIFNDSATGDPAVCH